MIIWKGKPMRMGYRARAAKTGLSDVTVTLFNPNGTKVLDGASMTEDSNGFYYTTYAPNIEGSYYGYADSASTPGARVIEFTALSKPAGGSVTKVYEKNDFTPDETRELMALVRDTAQKLELLDTAVAQQVQLTEKFEERTNQMKEVILENSERIKENSKSIDSSSNESGLKIVNLSESVDGVKSSTRGKLEDLEKSLNQTIAVMNAKYDGISNQLDGKLSKVNEENRETWKKLSILNQSLTTDIDMMEESKRVNESRIERIDSRIDELTDSMASLAEIVLKSMPSDRLMELDSKSRKEANLDTSNIDNIVNTDNKVSRNVVEVNEAAGSKDEQT